MLAAAFLVSQSTVAGPSLPQAQVYAGGGLLSFDCRTLDSIDAHSVVPANLERSRFGGWNARRVAATGFFRVEQIQGRWWAVDPDGYLFTHLALNSIHLDDFTADAIYEMLPAFGFNGTGSWTDDELFESSLKDTAPLAYCPKISFLAEYRRQRDPRIEMPVFDAAFEAFCHSRAQAFARYVGDAHVFGYFSDNELPWRDEGLAAHLAIGDTDDPNYTTALGFLASRAKTASNWDTEDRNAYMARMAERYYQIVSGAIRQVDPNHIYLGSRCHSTEQTITSNNSPPGATVLATWSHGDDVDIDVTDVLRNALGGDRKLSFRVISTLNNGSIPAYGSRENPDPVAQPQLMVVSHPTCYRAWAATQGLTERVNDGHGDDPDGDGLINLMEFALGADPLAADADVYRPRLEHPQRQGDDYLNYVYPRRIDRDDCGLTYSVEGVTALTSPVWRTNGVEEAGTMAIDGEFESVTNRVSTGEDARRFIQLKVTTPQ